MTVSDFEVWRLVKCHVLKLEGVEHFNISLKVVHRAYFVVKFLGWHFNAEIFLKRERKKSY